MILHIFGYSVMKRVFDLTLIIFSLPLLFPVLALVALLVRIKLGSPVLFSQVRPGKDGQSFKMIKFRTMSDEYDSYGNLLPDENRLPEFGRFLRSTSLDELPELWNVLKGEMSLIGPRPLLMEYLPLYNMEQMRRHNVRPGITGWAQVNGRNAISWKKKLQLDTWYVDNQSLWLDIQILILTVKKVLIRNGIVADGHVTTEKFKGNDS